MEALIIIALILAGLLLFIVEVFLIPGISIAGIASVICILYANYYAFSALGPEAGFLTLALKKSLDYKINPLKGLNIKVGNKGITVTRLALIGNAEISGHIIEVRSADGLIDEKTPIYVERIVENTVIVRKLK